MTDDNAFDLRADRIRVGKVKEPFLCPQCGRVWVAGEICNPARGGCGFKLPIGKKSRPVCTMEGELKHIDTALFPARKICERPEGPRIWENIFWRARSKKWNATFRQAEALFFNENYSWPNRSWPLMPKDDLDFGRKAGDMPFHKLIGGERHG
jgi:hypothetical protein